MITALNLAGMQACGFWSPAVLIGSGGMRHPFLSSCYISDKHLAQLPLCIPVTGILHVLAFCCCTGSMRDLVPCTRCRAVDALFACVSCLFLPCRHPHTWLLR
jgi:hypothetical protein